MRLFGPYYYGKHKWDNYLLDIKDSIKFGNDANQRSMKEHTKAFGIAHEEKMAAFREQTEQMHHIEDALRGGFEELRAEFEWGFTLMVDSMETQIDQLSQIAARLDAIHRTLQSPLVTQARELFQLGQEHFRKGLLDKALEAYLKAEEKNEVDFPLQLQIGKLYLYGRDEDDDVIDLSKAEKHLLLAARYADAEKGTFEQWNEYCGQAYFHAAIAAYLIGEQEQAAQRHDSTRACLERALGYLNKAVILWPRFTEIVYTQAKCHALLGQVKDAEHKLALLSDRDRRYFAKAIMDGDFATLQTDVEEVFKGATVSPGPLARAAQTKLDELAETIVLAKRAAPTSSDDLAAIETIERDVLVARRTLPTLDVDIESLSEDLGRMKADVEKIAHRVLQEHVLTSDQNLAACEHHKSTCESSIGELEQTMKQTSGAGLGCFLFFLFPAVIIGAFNLLFGPKPPQTLVGIAVFLTVATPFLGVALGSRISRERQNRPHRAKVQEFRRAIDESSRTVVPLKQHANAWRRELHNFEEWQSRHSV
jgi:tetratricopeptide (TPR) repeat protein